MLIDKPVASITAADLDQLVADSVREGLRLDLKRDLYEWNDAGTREFLADVSSFANASGGLLLIGVDETDGCAAAVSGVVGPMDSEIQRMVEKIQSGIEPRLQGVDIGAVQIPSGDSVIVVRIPRSWSRPHMVTFKNLARFYSRNSSGKYQLDVHELRSAILGAERIGDQIRSLRVNRIANIEAGETPVVLEAGAKLMLHAIPFSAMEPGAVISIPDHNDINMMMQPIASAGWSWRFNFDGLMTFTNPNHPEASTYLQLFRSGMVEAVDCRTLREWEGKRFIPSIKFEQELLAATNRIQQLLAKTGQSEPVAWLLTLLGVRGYFMGVGSYSLVDHGERIDRDIIAVPEVLQTSLDLQPEAIVRQLTDPVWQACGFERSLYFTGEGKWQPR